MFFDATYDDMSQVPKAISHRLTVTTPPTLVGAEHTAVGRSIPIGREAIVISPPFKGNGWVNGNGCLTGDWAASIRHQPNDWCPRSQRDVRHRLGAG
jgi:hypothetical protein